MNVVYTLRPRDQRTCDMCEYSTQYYTGRYLAVCVNMFSYFVRLLLITSVYLRL